MLPKLIFDKSHSFIIYYLGVYWSTSSAICGLVGFFFCMLVSFIFGESFCFPESGLERFYIILVGALGFLEQATTFLAVKFESAAIVALLYKAFEVIFSFVFQILIFKVIFQFLCFHNEVKSLLNLQSRIIFYLFHFRKFLAF